jgi:fructoselysine-6-P-deglycase FrlB-like protein
MAQAWAAAREQAGYGETDAFTPSEALPRSYDFVVALTRSGTTTEVLDYVRDLGGGVQTVAVTGTPGSPVTAICDGVVLLDFADERSPMQTRFATSALALLRTHLGDTDIGTLADAAEGALAEPLAFEPASVRQFVFLGHGLGVGLAREAALKLQEAAGAWTEAYPSTEFRHGPGSAIDAKTVVWAFNQVPPGLAETVQEKGATFIQAERDPMVELVVAHRVAVALVESKGLDPDNILCGVRSVIIPADTDS